MARIVRWGILGPGAISTKFAADLRLAHGAELAAVGSRSERRSREFAAKFGAPRAHASYEALVSDADVDAVYVGTPHPFHAEHTLLCLSHGKHVLCEKPMALNATEARRMAREARSRDRLLMEAMWMRFLPAVQRVRELLDEGAIGDPRHLSADFGFHAKFDPSSRLFDPELGGGTLLDLGIYPLSLAWLLFGAPVEFEGFANLGATGVDEDSAFVLRHAGGQISQGLASFRVDTAREALIQGTRGWIRIHAPWWASEEITLGTKSDGETTIRLPFRGRGYVHEAEAFMELIRRGATDSPVMPVDETVAILECMDELRGRWGLRYPSE